MSSQYSRIRTHANPLNYKDRMTPIEFQGVFSHFSGKLDLEIGFGNGLFLKRYSALFPTRNIVGVEVRKRVVDLVRSQFDLDPKPNVFLVHGTAEILLEDVIPDAALEHVFIFHPDPWFKKRHQKRRVVSAPFLQLLAKKMTPEGSVYLSTDVEALHQEMCLCFDQSSDFKKTEDLSFWEAVYQTHWALHSEKIKRSTFQAVFTRDSALRTLSA